MRYLILLSMFGCAELKSGWVKTEFMEGAICEYCVCEMKIKNDDIHARCVSLETVEAEVERRHNGGSPR